MTEFARPEHHLTAALLNTLKRDGLVMPTNGSITIPEYVINGASARPDLALVNGHLTAYEIKSDADSLKRLETQIPCYLQLFNCVNVVSGRSHVPALKKSLPKSVGIASISENSETLNWHRKSQKRKLTKANIIRHLNLNEIKTLARKRNFYNDELRRSELAQLTQKHYPLIELESLALHILKDRFSDWFKSITPYLRNEITAETVARLPKRTVSFNVETDTHTNEGAEGDLKSIPEYVIGKNGIRVPTVKFNKNISDFS